MANFESLNDNLNKIFEKIYSSQTLCKLLLYNFDNPLIENDIEDPSILYTDKNNQKLFPYPFTPDTTIEQKSILNVVLDKFTLGNKNTKTKLNKIDFIVIVHTELWNINDGSGKIKLRPFLILEELDKLFNGQRIAGIGENNFNYASIVWANTDFVGYKVSYDMADFS